jgi:asparagine synthetase B (glutamine-hydrolysing)
MTYKKSHKGMPSFGGIISKAPVIAPDRPHIDKIFTNEGFSVFTLNTPRQNNYYSFSKDRFIWNGGRKLKSDYSNFEIHKNDDKFVVLNFDEHSVKLYTDHYSKIPLFYTLNKSSFVFATSLELLLLLNPEKEMTFNPKGVLFYYNFGCADYQNYLLENIRSVPGGQEITYDLNSLQLSQSSYHNIFEVGKYTNNRNDLETNVQKIDSALFDATRTNIENYKSIGIALSGGVDSRYLAQKINECGRDFLAYTLGFQNDYNEFDRIDYLAKKLDFPVKKIIVGPEVIIKNYFEVLEGSSFPVGFNNSIMNFIYKEANADGIDLMFDGDGADRLFLGMNKYLQLKKILQLYKTAKKFRLSKLMAQTLQVFSHPTAKKLGFYFKKFHNGIPFYGERILANDQGFDLEYELKLNGIALPGQLKALDGSVDEWLFFSLFSTYYTPGFFFHTPYELQLSNDLVSNPQFWSNQMVDLALSIPVSQKLYKKTTKMVLREAAKLKIDDGYWGLSKIGLQNSYEYIKNSPEGKTFINDHVALIKRLEEFEFLNELIPQKQIDAERLLPYYLWKKTIIKK